ncbi:hypothetical protein HYDPIDRAFT_93120, partial [Hydnomerulius pinastri MD-312]
VFGFLDFKLALLRFQVQVVCAEDFKDAFHHTMVFFKGGREDHDVLPEDVVHHCLERCRGVGEAEEHDRRLEEPAVGPESGLPLISFFDADIVVSPTYVQLSENFGVLELIHQLLDEREGVSVLDRHRV